MKLSSPKDVNAPVDTHAVIYNPDIFGIVKTPGLLLPTSVSMWWQTASLVPLGTAMYILQLWKFSKQCTLKHE